MLSSDTIISLWALLRRNNKSLKVADLFLDVPNNAFATGNRICRPREAQCCLAMLLLQPGTIHCFFLVVCDWSYQPHSTTVFRSQMRSHEMCLQSCSCVDTFEFSILIREGATFIWSLKHCPHHLIVVHLWPARILTANHSANCKFHTQFRLRHYLQQLPVY